MNKVEGLELNIYYQKNKSIYRLYIINDKYKVFKYDENNENPREQSDFKLDDFFYTEVINYSYTHTILIKKEIGLIKFFIKMMDIKLP